jgi:hypothetical protein
VVLDGATHFAGVDTGCIHDVRWLVGHLATALVEQLVHGPANLSEAMASAIESTCSAHAGTCDLANPGSEPGLVTPRGNGSGRWSEKRPPLLTPSISVTSSSKTTPHTPRKSRPDYSAAGDCTQRGSATGSRADNPLWRILGPPVDGCGPRSARIVEATLGRMSRFAEDVRRAVARGDLPQRFRPDDVRRACPGWANHTYGVFLPKHRRGNPGGYTEYFLRNPDGSYSLVP